MKKALVPGLILFIILFAALPYSAGAADEDLLKYTSSGNAFVGVGKRRVDRNTENRRIVGTLSQFWRKRPDRGRWLGRDALQYAEKCEEDRCLKDDGKTRGERISPGLLVDLHHFR